MSEKPSGPGPSSRTLVSASNRHGSHNATGHGRVHAQCRADPSASVSSTQTSWSMRCRTVELKIIQEQAGHSWASTTAVYTTVGQDARNRMLRSALDRAFREGEQQ